MLSALGGMLWNSRALSSGASVGFRRCVQNVGNCIEQVSFASWWGVLKGDVHVRRSQGQISL